MVDTKNFSQTNFWLFHFSVDEFLSTRISLEWQQLKSSEPKSAAAPKLAQAAEKSHSRTVTGNKPDGQKPFAQGKSPKKKTRYVAASVRRSVYCKSGGQCTYVDESTGRRCSARRHLELDHIKPFARGGDQSADNLQVLCRSHNLMRARDEFGTIFMEQFGHESIEGAR